MTQRYRAARLLWARRHLIWRRADWNQVLFTDESRFTVSHADGRLRVYRHTNERFAYCCIVEKNRFGGGSGNSIAQRYVTDVLNAYALPFIRQHGPGVTLMHDNVRPHVARVTTQFLQQSNVNIMPWPAVSPDLNPTEHIWDQLSTNYPSD
ncbi:TCB2-like protein [Mya arenaria]|uniref:TCB2-like protein n=1 Tax=Mya arenaria TaxID=6604 RepID=A0ABY7GAR9_MYAAR|nr:TCB2-like protein [Mya arenaria]